MNNDTILPFSSTEALRFGWTKTKENMRPLLIIGAAGAFLALVAQALGRSDAPFSAFLVLVVQVLQVAVWLAYVWTALRLHDGQPVDPGRVSELFPSFFSFLLVSVLQGLIFAFGLLLLVVPGIIWTLAFGFAGFVAVDQKVDPMTALRESSWMTHGLKWPLFRFALMVIGINLVGAIALGVGLLVTIPTTVIATAYVFRRLQAREVPRPGTIPAIGDVPAPLTDH